MEGGWVEPGHPPTADVSMRNGSHKTTSRMLVNYQDAIMPKAEDMS